MEDLNVPKIIKHLKNRIKELRYHSNEFNLELYQKWIHQINKFEYETLSDQQLQAISNNIISQVRSGMPLTEFMASAFSLIREAANRVLHLRPFNVQMIAGMVMHNGYLVEMQTGEGKTLAAVFPAYLNALSGKGVHILTFNDYLAKRDAEWMGPLYQFLGLSVGYIQEGMDLDGRRRAYCADVTYLTAKEAGFDYLRGFLCQNKMELVQRPFNYAIIDEADSILIDEARIPLVIAGRTNSSNSKLGHIMEIIRSLKAHEDYEIDENSRNVYLTEKGLKQVEEALKCNNLYDGSNLNLLVDINNVLHAEVLLKRDVDYIVRNKKIELVDELSGRIAEKRQWPYGLQEAIETKEGIQSESKGQIITSITLQHFIKMYSKVCGMTGTAIASAREFKEFYGLQVVVIPTNRPSIRIDYPEVIFTHKEAKYNAVVKEILHVHKTGRPILIGTCSIEESELLADKLRTLGISSQVLNAKNDELEAHIVATAGSLGAITVSTNMAGRGTDIKLGVENEEDRKKIVELGGLYIIGTNLHESSRVDNQLKGRAGRQGDPGSTRFFISLEDDLMKRYNLKNLIPAAVYPENQDDPIDNHIIKRKFLSAQRIIESQNFDIRKTLWKYSVVIEQQRRIIHQWRDDVILERINPNLMKERLGERYAILCSQIGSKVLSKVESQVTLYFINKCWSEYLDYMSYIRESSYLANFGGKVPIDEYNKASIQAFQELRLDIENEIIRILEQAQITQDGIDIENEGLNAPTSTWTYLVNDLPEQFGVNPIVTNPIVAALSGPLVMVVAIYHRFFRKIEKVD